MSKSVEVHGFFLNCAIGFEEALLVELHEVWGFLLDLDGRPHSFPLEYQVEKGGIEIQAPLHLGLQLNYFLRLPHRILWRLRSFRCRDFPKLFAEAKKLKFPGPVRLEVAASKSRLNNEKRIFETVSEALSVDEKSRQTLFIRFFDDLCTFSLDSSGEHLHFRHGNLHKGEAPLRETIAAFGLWQMMGSLSAAEMATVEWLDPMMGSGTFLQEVATLNAPNASRTFAFQAWPETPKVLKSAQWLQNYPVSPKLYKNLQGFDQDAKIVQTAKDNFSKLGISLTAGVQDIFSTADKVEKSSRCWVVTNPPYGERLAVSFEPLQLLSSIIKKWAPEKIGILWSSQQARTLKDSVEGPHGHWRKSQSLPVLNGGIKCEFQIWDFDPLEKNKSSR